MKSTYDDDLALKAALEALFDDPDCQASLIGLPGGAHLFSAGDEADHLYFVRSGRLGVFRLDEDTGENRLIGVICAGEPIGEMSLISGTPRSANVMALRDCDLLALPREAFFQAIERHPKLLLMVSRKMIARQKSRIPIKKPTVFGFYSISQAPIIDLVKKTAEKLQKRAYRVFICDQEFHGKNTDVFHRLEQDHDFVLHVCELTQSHWRLMSMRQVDHAFFVANAQDEPNLDTISSCLSLSPRAPDLILSWPEEAAASSNNGIVLRYLTAVSPSRHFHISPKKAHDLDRLARLLCGETIGLVLSGGGARAFAHIGAVQALMEAKVPFDFIGGASMGAIIGACLAHGWSFSETQERIREAFVLTSPLDDMSFPMISMSSGKKVDERLRAHFGDMMIEDLPVPFYCVSSNLTNGQILIHRTGLLREALRASVALPGILPPVIMDGQVLVDGGVMRSFPSGIMRNLHLGSVVGIDVTRARGLDPKSIDVPPNLPSWILSGKWRQGPPIVSILMRSATITTAADLALARAATDLLIIPEPGNIEIRDFHAYDEAVLEGYRSACESLSHLSCPVEKMRNMGIHLHPNVPTFTKDDPHKAQPLEKKPVKKKISRRKLP